MSQAIPAQDPPPSDAAPPGVRLVLLAWCLWLLVSWAVTLTINSTVPAVRGMVMMALLGLMAVWPAMRLSQPTTWRGRAGQTFSETLLEWVCLLLVFQAVIWPLRLTGGWPMLQAWSLNSAVAGWSLGAALAVAWGRVTDHPLRRVVAMAGCLLLLLGEPVILAAVSTAATWTLVLSPLETVWQLTAPAEQYAGGAWPMRAAGALVVGVGAWLLVGVALRLRR